MAEGSPSIPLFLFRDLWFLKIEPTNQPLFFRLPAFWPFDFLFKLLFRICLRVEVFPNHGIFHYPSRCNWNRRSCSTLRFILAPGMFQGFHHVDLERMNDYSFGCLKIGGEDWTDLVVKLFLLLGELKSEWAGKSHDCRIKAVAQ